METNELLEQLLTATLIQRASDLRVSAIRQKRKELDAGELSEAEDFPWTNFMTAAAREVRDWRARVIAAIQ
jgi:hypothetical protein